MSKDKKYKLDIFKLLGHINKKDIEYYKNLTEEQKNAFSPYTVLLWMSCTTNPMQVGFLNALLNPYIFHFKSGLYEEDHSELLYLLMTLCALKPNQRYNWIKTKRAKSESKALDVVKRYYKYSQREAKIMLPLMSNSDIISYAKDLGLQKEEMASLEKELKNR